PPAAPRRRDAVHPGVAGYRHLRLIAHVVATRGDDGRAGWNDAAESTALRIRLPDREFTAPPPMDLERGAGAMVRAHRTRNHAQGCRVGVFMARDSDPARDVRRAARAQRAFVPRAARSMRRSARRVLFLARAEVLHVVRD